MDLLDNWFQSIRSGNLKEVVSIYKSNPDIINTFTTINDGRNHYKTNAIIEASFQGNRDLVKWLIDNNADVNSVSDGGWRPIHFAAQHGHVTTVNLLVLGGAEVNVKTETNETPILLALQSYMRDTVKKLMYHGASLIGIDKSYLHMWIQKDVLDPSSLDEDNKIYLSDPTYNKPDVNGYDIMIRQPEREIEEIKLVKVTKSRLITEYDNDLKRRRQELVKKMRRANEQPGALTTLIRKVALSDNADERMELVKEGLKTLETQEGQVPQTKTLDHLINLLELCICDSDSTTEFIRAAGQLMMEILQHNVRRGDSAVVDFWCRIFDKMSNLQIEQYTNKILEMLSSMLESASETVLSNFRSNKDSFLKTWEIFFENLGFPKCLNGALIVLKLVHRQVPEAVNHRFHNVIDIMIGWCIHPDTDMATLETLRMRSSDLHECWVADVVNLKKTIVNLQKDIISHCQQLSRIHRLDKDRSQVDDLRLKIRYFCFALSCVTAGLCGLSDVSDVVSLLLTNNNNNNSVKQPLSPGFLVTIVDKLCEALIMCSKQVDFDNLLLQADTIILHLVSCLGGCGGDSGGGGEVSWHSSVLKYIFSSTQPLQSRTVPDIANSNINYNTRQLLLSHLDLVYICCRQSSGALEPSLVVQIFSPVSWVHSCLFYGTSVHKPLLKRLLRIVDIFIGGQSSPNLTTTFYQILLSDIELAINSLLKAASVVKQVHLVQSNPFKAKCYEPEQAEFVLRYNIGMVMFLHHHYKQSSCSGALVPSIPVLLVKYLAFSDRHAVEKYPEMALFILENCYEVIVCDSSSGSEQGLSEAFAKSVCVLLAVPSVASRAWDMLQESGSAVGLSVCDMVLGAVAQCDARVLEIVRRHGEGLKAAVRKRVREVAVRETVDLAPEVRFLSLNTYHSLLDNGHDGDGSVAEEVKTLQSILLRGRSFKFPLDFSRTIFSWIISSGGGGGTETARLLDLVSDGGGRRDRLVAVYEMVTNACWDCVRQKLKFDNNGDSRITLMTIENMVKSILTNGNSLKAVNDKRFRKMMAGFSAGSVAEQSASVNVLLLLLDVLEKMFYNSYEGCSVGLPAVGKTTENFFVTNRHVCCEWFVKMRLMIVAVAQYAGQWAVVVWHGMELLKYHLDLQQQGGVGEQEAFPELEDCVVFTAMALSKLGNWECLLGLGRLAVSLYGPKFIWIEALADKTLGHLETALERLEDYVKTSNSKKTTTVAMTTKGGHEKSGEQMRLLRRKSSGHSCFILCMEEIADCHRLLADCEKLEEWRSQMELWREDSMMVEAHKSQVNWGRLACLAKLSRWTASDGEFAAPSPSPLLQKTELSWKTRSVTDHCEDVLFSSALSKSTEQLPQVETLVAQLSSSQSLCDFPHSLTNPELVLIYERTKHLREAARLSETAIVVDCKALASLSPTLPLSVINFVNVLHNTFSIPDSFINHNYLIRWHRRLHNFSKSRSLIGHCLSAFLAVPSLSEAGPLGSSRAPIIQMELQRQSMKLLWATGQRQQALELLTNSLKEGLLFETSDVAMHTYKCRLNTKSLLTLFQWLSNDQAAFSYCTQQGVVSSNLQFLTDLAEVPWINGLPLVSPQQRSLERSCHSSVTDVCGQLLILASKSKNQDNSGGGNSDKSFMTLAHWCFSRSRSLDQQGLADPHSIATITQQLQQLNIEGLDDQQTQAVTQLFSTTFQPARMNSDSDWLGLCYDDDLFTQELLASLTALCPKLPATDISRIGDLWNCYVSRYFSLHIAASDAYFSFLKNDSKATQENSNDSSSSTVCNQNRTTANLRILSLLGKRSRSLRRAIITKIKTSPPSSWTNVVPQLFARIKHPDSAIRASVTELLSRFALSGDGNRSTLIIYPTIVGTMNEQDSSLSACTEIRQVLTDRNSCLVYEVDMFIKELRRITVLWDELWIASLSQCHEELNKKSGQLQIEIERLTAKSDCCDNVANGDDDNNNGDNDDERNKQSSVILQLKYNSIIQPALFILERVRAATSLTPETPRESWFHNTFNEEINSTINAIKSPANIFEFKDSWKKVKELQELMITESNDNSKIRLKRGRHQFLSLKLNEISPSLSKISKSCIPIPGMENIELVSVDSHISILPTKTKPKKLQFVASNGKSYNYLYKGLEDLRLDERIMQIFGIANTMFSKLNERESNRYHITTYNVTPLGPRAGLIQMVEDATSLFTLYKRHQMRSKSSMDLFKSRYRSNANNPTDNNEATVVSEEGHPIRPTDIYWQKLRPKLELAKLDPGFDNRDKWPLSILIEVLNELKRETPGDLLSKELWCCSINCHNWFQSSIAFTRSCAVMSMMGHILGLGDRHLDNLLVNLSTGQMVHIDYNVCFDKGASLKVPEKVPFRLTDIITDVFGPVGVEGLFKTSCERVMEMVQQTRDNVLTLMDTFVLDPIVDWSSGIESGHYGSFEGGKFAVSTPRSVVEKKSVEFVIGLNGLQAVLVTMEGELESSGCSLRVELDRLSLVIERNVDMCRECQQLEQSCRQKEAMIERLARYEVDDGSYYDILQQAEYVKTVETRALALGGELERRLGQMAETVSRHGDFLNMVLSNSDFISFKLDLKNLSTMYQDTVATLDSAGVSADIGQRLASLAPEIASVEGCVVLFDRYRQLLQEMPEQYYGDDRCTYMTTVTKQLIEERTVENLELELGNYRFKWMTETGEEQLEVLRHERNSWQAQLQRQLASVAEVSTKMAGGQNNEEEIQQLEAIWQMTMYEPMGVNVFKAVLLEQYLEMATVASQLDSAVPKVPEQVSLVVDCNDSLRRYLQLLNCHENYSKILSNSVAVLGLYLNVNEATVVCNMMSSLHKVVVTLASFESNFIDIIMPEAVKIMRLLSPEDEQLLQQLCAVVKDSDNILLHFNIALTSSTYDIQNYDSIHSKTVLPLRETMASLTDISAAAPAASRQLRVLLASFYGTLSHTCTTVSDFVDCCISSSTPSSWNYLDLVAASGLAISPMWKKSHQLLKDAVYVTALRALVNTLTHCRAVTAPLSDSSGTGNMAMDGTVDNMLHHVELYFNFVSRHIVAGVGSQCFGKMFCLLLEFAGWNLDAMIADSVPSCVLSADYISSSVSSFRKSEYANGANFYGQLQFRFNSYKALTLHVLEPRLSHRFLSRNLAFHKSVAKLARNQLLSLCWMNKELIQNHGERDNDEDNGYQGQLSALLCLLDSLPHRLSQSRSLLNSIDSLINSIEDNSQGRVREALKSLRKRVSLVHEAMVNMDRFECVRSKSERSAEFDCEVVQFLSDTKQLLEELSRCSGLIKPIEAEIITYKERNKVDGDRWWKDLMDLLRKEVCGDKERHREQSERVAEAMSQYDSELAQLKTVLSQHYYPHISQLKPALRVLYSVTRKLKCYVSNSSDSLSLFNHQVIKSKLGYVLKLMSLFEKFNSTVDNISLEYNSNCVNVALRLDTDFTNLSILKNSIIPELFNLFRLLSPHNHSDDDNNMDYENNYNSSDIIIQLSSNNNSNMSEGGNGDSIVTKLSWTAQEEHDSVADGRQELDTLQVVDKRYITNSTGVQRAVEVWKMVESRLNMASSSNMSAGTATGMVADKMSKQAVSLHVDKCIRAARNPDNLARMYEGWTAWV